MKISNSTKAFFFICIYFAGIIFLFYSCGKESPVAPDHHTENEPKGDSDDDNSSDNTALYTSFKTSAWSEKIDCSQLSFQPQSCEDSIHYVTATSQSTGMKFHIAYPIDSATLSKLSLKKRFPMRSPTCLYATALQEAITFMVTIPESKGAKNTWAPLPEKSENSYAVLKAITYVKSDSHYAHFRVAGSYSQLSALADEQGKMVSDKRQVITGDFQLIIMVDRTSIAQQPDRQADKLWAESETAFAGYVHSALEEPLEVHVQNEWGMDLENAEVHWTVTEGNGTVSANTTRTDLNGRTKVSWTLGDAEFQEVKASIVRYDGKSIDPVVFKATAADNHIVLISGDKQSGQSGFPLRNPVILQVMDRHGKPISGSQVEVHAEIIKGKGAWREYVNYWMNDSVGRYVGGDANRESLTMRSDYENGQVSIDRWTMGIPGEPQELRVSLRNTAKEVLSEYIVHATSHDTLGMIAAKLTGKWVVKWEGGQQDFYKIAKVEGGGIGLEGLAPTLYGRSAEFLYTKYLDGRTEVPQTENDRLAVFQLLHTPYNGKYWFQLGRKGVSFLGTFNPYSFTFKPAEGANYQLVKVVED